MSYQITHVRLSFDGNQEEHITDVKLSVGIIQTRDEVVRNIDRGQQYYFVIGGGRSAKVISVHPYFGPPYIRTAPDNTLKDNLLSLPRF